MDVTNCCQRRVQQLHAVLDVGNAVNSAMPKIMPSKQSLAVQLMNGV